MKALEESQRPVKMSRRKPNITCFSLIISEFVEDNLDPNNLDTAIKVANDRFVWKVLTECDMPMR